MRRYLRIEAASGEVLVCFREARNHHDRYGVAIEKNGMILLLTSWLLEPPVRFSIDNGISAWKGLQSEWWCLSLGICTNPSDCQILKGPFHLKYHYRYWSEPAVPRSKKQDHTVLFYSHTISVMMISCFSKANQHFSASCFRLTHPQPCMLI